MLALRLANTKNNINSYVGVLIEGNHIREVCVSVRNIYCHEPMVLTAYSDIIKSPQLRLSIMMLGFERTKR
jgi:hypothetical protein